METEAMQEQETPNKPQDFFIDTEGRQWKPRITTEVLVEGCLKCNIQIKDLFKGAVNAGSLIRLIWFACKYQADTYGIKNEQMFMDEVLTIDKLFDGIAAITVAVVDTLPQAETALREVFKGGSPLGNGD
jgi:hypothetical protein